ncbi:PAS domain S-box-containing protein [Flavobacteriaceae bacterium MAR_2009_75]|nr:PAS domain S-box-containing protein [Flavobacteriaceae bacterium MAR_2009_75]
MSEMKLYDKAAERFYRSKPLNCFPLLSHDFTCNYFDAFCEHFSDSSDLWQLSQVNNWDGFTERDKNSIKENLVVIVTDMNLKIVFASSNISDLTGYKKNEVIGRKPSMFQGSETSESVKNRIRTAVGQGRSFEETLINYKKNGSPYTCSIKGKPLFDKKGELVNFIAYERAVA